MDFTTLFFIDTAGYHTSDYPTVLAWLQGVYQGIYGADVYLGADSQDGQFVAIIAQALFDMGMLGANIYNSFSPVTSQGVGLSRVVKINGLKRGIPTNSTVDLTIVGVAGTNINNGIAIDTLQQQWLLPALVTIPSGGTITVTATAQNAGAVTAAPATVTGIFTPTLGWQTVNNVSAASEGAPVETDAALRVRQAISTSIPAQTVFEATVGALENLTGVTKVGPYENFTNSTDGNGAPPHSVYFVMAGGDATEIAQTILNYKTPGTDTYGTTVVLVHDSRGMPYNIHFFVATPATIGAQITVNPLAGWSTDFEALIAQAVANTINAVGIGQVIQYTTLFLAAYLPGTPQFGTFDVEIIAINKNGGPFASANIALNFDENPVCDPTTDVTVIP